MWKSTTRSNCLRSLQAASSRNNSSTQALLFCRTSSMVEKPSTSAALSQPDGQTRNLSDLKFLVNLTDTVFRGKYHGRRKHEDDLQAVLSRSQAAGVKSMIITGGSLHESAQALQLAKKHGLYATVGCHPTCSTEFDKHPAGPDAYLQKLDTLIQSNLTGPGRVVAVGECGLDYDRTHFASPDVQRKYFRIQLTMAKKYHLPLFLHSRSAHEDFVKILREEGFGVDGGRQVGGKGGVVHSFTGTVVECEEYTSMGFYVSLNGCSMKTDGNLLAAKTISLDRIILETDAPWCSMTSTHASRRHLDSLPSDLREIFLPPSTKPENFQHGKMVKGRNEPCTIGAVAWVVHKIHEGVTYEELVGRAWLNTVELFELHEIA
ncbi:Mg-dependent DNase [Artomyces pyxidatus]|uniref:Mg-dependent DNase n=1 Tax=Artomyces pyxidatus TaxID=48021 RepID=A0ACB8TIP2_9AGAM|nr:Mg-dependent DNase [Artomyces pyxidatus]